DRDLWLKEIASHDALFFSLYDRLPKEMSFMRELLVSNLWRAPEMGLQPSRPVETLKQTDVVATETPEAVKAAS
ncbi:MAG: hypothetical protein JO314_09620, partial [Acidobacteria bacterium]|nr:hypothetical protein [Acidobacteriota bacterium]